MKSLLAPLLVLSAAAAVSAVSVRDGDQVVLYPEVEKSERFLIELAPGETRWVAEEDKWDLRRVSTVHSLDLIAVHTLPGANIGLSKA